MQVPPLVAFVVVVLVNKEFLVEGSQKYEYVGCYKDHGGRDRPMQFIMNYRTHEYIRKWTREELRRIVKLCARDAETRGFLYFSIQFFGECWSGSRAHLTYNRDGPSESDVCEEYGVGGEWENAVYRLLGKDNECSDDTYKVLDSADRKSTYEYHGNGRPECDLPGFAHAWYRFQGDAGDVIATSCPAYKHCGTISPGWMAGKLPYDVINGTVTRKVCFRKLEEQCCHANTRTILVRNCGDFFVFKLPKTPGCALRYCGNTTSMARLTRSVN